MTQQTRTALKELQTIDLRILDSRKRIQDFDPLFAEVEEPALILEGEVGTTRKRLQEMTLEERRLELSTEEKRARVTRLDERLGSVRNLREEAAVSAELDMVKRALQSDEQEAYTMLDQIRKLDERMEELEAAWKEAQALVEPRMKELVGERDKAKKELATLEAERTSFVAAMDEKEIRLYDGIRAGGRTFAVADMTHDGACGHCFGVVPLQIQNEIRHGTSLIRCEACGVILAAPDPAAEETPAADPPAPEATAESAPEAAPEPAPEPAAEGDAPEAESPAKPESAKPESAKPESADTGAPDAEEAPTEE
jgi:predicted  nucleic acid-binding Zn-ribbon protein